MLKKRVNQSFLYFINQNRPFKKPQQQADGEDELKKRQLMELAIINGTYRDSSTKAAATGNCLLFYLYIYIHLRQLPDKSHSRTNRHIQNQKAGQTQRDALREHL